VVTRWDNIYEFGIPNDCNWNPVKSIKTCPIWTKLSDYGRRNQELFKYSLFSGNWYQQQNIWPSK
jgi:hypothetical protein